MRIQSPHHAVSRIHHQSEGDPNGPGEVYSYQGVASPPDSEEFTEVSRLRKFLSSVHQGFQPTYCPFDVFAPQKAQVPAWNTSAPEAFEDLKSAFITAPILRLPDPHVPFVVEVDASTTGVGDVLSKHFDEPPCLQSCTYYSKKLSSAEQNYDIGNWELLAIKLALEEWRHWLEGANHPFVVITDHKKSPIPPWYQTAQSLPGSLGAFLHEIPIPHHLPSRESKLQGECPFPPALPRCTIRAWANPPSSPNWESDSMEHQQGHSSHHSDRTFSARRPRRESICSHLTTAVPSVLGSPSTPWCSGHPCSQRTLSLLQPRYWWSSISCDVTR